MLLLPMMISVLSGLAAYYFTLPMPRKARIKTIFLTALISFLVSLVGMVLLVSTVRDTCDGCETVEVFPEIERSVGE